MKNGGGYKIGLQLYLRLVLYTGRAEKRKKAIILSQGFGWPWPCTVLYCGECVKYHSSSYPTPRLYTSDNA